MRDNSYYLSDVEKSYTVESGTHKVLEHVNLTIASNEITILLGKSGCGKTTMLRLLAGLEVPTSGQIGYMQEGVNIEPKVGIVFQESRLMPWLTVEENICLPYKGGKLEEDTLVRYLKLMGLEKFRRAYPNQLSGGMAQRVSIARALCYEPHLLFMDEPFSALDYFTRLQMQEELIRVYEETQKGIVFVTHNIEEALALGHRILILRQGQPIESYDIPYGYPRNLTDSFFLEAKKHILELF